LGLQGWLIPRWFLEGLFFQKTPPRPWRKKAGVRQNAESGE
jgi:hypothetical protein